jgi:uncharacterized protein YycO
MRDIKLENGDVFVDVTGGSVLLSEEESAVQRALILAGAHRGSFVYNRSLGSDYRPGMDEMQAEAVINEAFADDENMYIRVSESGEALIVDIPTKNGSVQREVHFYG